MSEKKEKTISKETLHTEAPLSEKDEVKIAEEKMRKKGDSKSSSVAADLKNRERSHKTQTK